MLGCFKKMFVSLKTSPPSVMTENRLFNEEEVSSYRIHCVVASLALTALNDTEGSGEQAHCHGLYTLIVFREKYTIKVKCCLGKEKKQKQKIAKFKKYLLYQTRVMDRIMMLSGPEPELHHKYEIFYEDQMETLNA